MTRSVQIDDLRPFLPAPPVPAVVNVTTDPSTVPEVPLQARQGIFLYAILTLALALPVLASVVAAVADWTMWSVLAVGLFAPSLLWIAGGAASALIGLFAPQAPRRAAPTGWRPRGDLAILVTLCGEDPVEVARRIAELRRDLNSRGLGATCTIFVLSDTRPGPAAAAEADAFAGLVREGGIAYRRRPRNIGRKPGNIADWYSAHGARFETMLILDADSRMSSARIHEMLYRMDSAPRLGLLQAGLGMVPGRTRFGRIQRTSVRLLGPSFARGFAVWSGATSNYWGHNAMLRTAAFAAAVRLPRLSGTAPLGGDILSHDIVEAAFIRRAGWEVRLDPDSAGSSEDGPQTLAAYNKRDRRWCQGNMQHLRLLAVPGLAAVSRLHLISGIFSYLAGVIWLMLVVFSAAGLLSLRSALPLVLIALLLLTPKLAGLWRLAGRGSTRWRRRIALRAAAAELAVSTYLSPTIMVRHTAAVASVLAGCDCGWKSPESGRAILPPGWPEAGVGLALAALAVRTDPSHLLLLLPVIVPLLAAPILFPALDKCP